MKVGVSRDDAALFTDSMIEANLRGVDTHGITRMLCVYVERIQKGVMSAKSNLDVVREKASTALIDCHNSIGQVGAARAMQMTIEKAATDRCRLLGRAPLQPLRDGRLLGHDGPPARHDRLQFDQRPGGHGSHGRPHGDVRHQPLCRRHTRRTGSCRWSWIWPRP